MEKSDIKKLHKRQDVFLFAAGMIAVLFDAAAGFLEITALKLITAAAGLLAEGFWTAYFSSIKYFYDDKYLIIESGVIFHKKRIIDREKILMKSGFSAGKRVFLTIIYTAGSTAFVFGDFLDI